MFRAALIIPSLFALSACAGEDAPPPRVSGADIYLTPDTTAIKGVVADRTTMDSMLRAHGLGAAAVEDVVTAARAVFDPRRLRSLQPFVLERTVDGALRLTPTRSCGSRARHMPPRAFALKCCPSRRRSSP
jgi:hypothetical protein